MPNLLSFLVYLANKNSNNYEKHISLSLSLPFKGILLALMLVSFGNAGKAQDMKLEVRNGTHCPAKVTAVMREQSSPYSTVSDSNLINAYGYHTFYVPDGFEPCYILVDLDSDGIMDFKYGNTLNNCFPLDVFDTSGCYSGITIWYFSSGYYSVAFN